ncbi:MAG: hypothetical protein KJP02_01720 [Octadecabacter sp.]|nr:hypothetical protein [Octadecabacter sp.]
MGYANGFRRDRDAYAAVVLGNRLAPVIRNSFKNLFFRDITDAKGVQTGDEATMFGGIANTNTSLARTETHLRTIMADRYVGSGNCNERILH